MPVSTVSFLRELHRVYPNLANKVENSFALLGGKGKSCLAKSHKELVSKIYKELLQLVKRINEPNKK